MKVGTLLQRLRSLGTVFVPLTTNARSHWRLLDGDVGAEVAEGVFAALRGIRPAEPVKSFLFASRQRVAAMPATAPGEPGRTVIFGMKNCDLVPLKVHERVLGEGEFSDPFYVGRSAASIRVVADCPVPEQSCFCNLPGLKPYAEAGADVLLSPLKAALLFESLTPAGEEFVKAAGDVLRPTTGAELAERDALRKSAVDALAHSNPKPWGADLPAAVAARLPDTAFWRKHAEACVECFACLMGCPTCYCFLLYDEARAAGFERRRVWDACYEAAYARVGGGANERGAFLKRFANRFACKWHDWAEDSAKRGLKAGEPAFFSCSGCGRCLRSCMGKIDIRRVLGESA